MPKGIERPATRPEIAPVSGVMEAVMIAISDSLPVYAARGYLWIEHNGARYRISIDRD